MKNLFSKRFLALGVIASLSFTACQKAETEANALQSNKKDAEMNVVGSAANASAINGLISESAAARMQETYKKNYSGKNFTEYVVFDAEDMEKYIKEIKKKYKSDKVYVYFGQYDEVTAPKPEYKGRVSVFFLGNNKRSNSGNFRSQDVGDGSTPGDGSNYLNHGTIWP
ncbi:MAG TPA: hypothetical protein VJA82_01430 [Sediminibacterium sp.]|uniref:hypothetical protein n=1 Tax=Sediminibacterium sp. TaxID=1917865 RepID=UPI0008BC9DBA|nr:hypothetical protein [Sediminibacterium sp.]OHC86703.1 MAG: hypothetical protein A2472_03835 [Sphingobacteriia bacterium RIFOXYC2_FULL_35_18]OHC88439.1 MAG: hypothetical protein A2546_13410 [Sphingobacteriia bacterium RIFOXYD2_FULL_35_12]HLD51940.1 hypothetical protein [Sediminibacterium sp.]